MTIDLYNKNVPNAQFRICWGIEQCTPVFTLSPGGSGSYDLSFSHTIRTGTQCHVQAWSSVTGRFDCGVTFVYESVVEGKAMFNYVINHLTHKADLKKIDK